ncbi:MAG: leucine-rich repeat domain-containing protein, partial [Ureaplasma sp.]|nr:leucine-rich repeat domain-containing protein [Ureaplasma sp.]
SGYLNYRIFDLFKAVKTVENQSLGEFINGNPTNSISSIQSLSTISVRIKSGLYKMDSKSLNNGNIKVENNNSISLNNLSLTSPDTYFNWNGDTVTGLTSLGRQQSVLAIPLHCTKINDSAFSGLTNIRQIKISGNVDNIGQNAFLNCTSLNTVDLREGITNIGQLSFSNTALSSVTIPNSITSIGIKSFFRCNSLTNMFINEVNSKLRFINEWAFGECPNLNTVKIPAACIEVQANAFAYSNKLNNVHIYSNIVTIYNYAFTFDLYWGVGNIYIYNITDPNNLALYASSFDYQNPTTLYVYVKNSSVKNKVTSVLNQHNPSRYVVNTF